MKNYGGISGARLICVGLFVIALGAATAPALVGQETPQDTPGVPGPPPTQAEPPATVRGVVLNEATGQPLPRALVRVQSTPERGALTDGEGRFVLHGVPGDNELD